MIVDIAFFSNPIYNQNNANALKEHKENGDEAPNSSIVSALTVNGFFAAATVIRDDNQAQLQKWSSRDIPYLELPPPLVNWPPTFR